MENANKHSDPDIITNPQYLVKPDKYGLLSPYCLKFDFEDEEHVDNSVFYGSDDDEDDRVPDAFGLVKRFLKQVRESRGYDVDCTPPPCFNSPFMPRIMFMDYAGFRDAVMEAVNFAIEKINEHNDKTYELVEVKNAVETRTFLWFLTFTAKEVESPVKTLRALVAKQLCTPPRLEEWAIMEDPVAVTATAG